MINKDRMPIFLGISFIWFTTQFGGGFASGRQVYDYFLKFGWYAVFTPVLAQLLQAFVFYYIFKFAHENKLFNYRSFMDKFYGNYKGVMSNFYEILYNITICLATAVAFATGGATLEQLTKIPYIICTLLIGMGIFGMTIFGASLVRKAASTISLIIIIGILIVFVPNIISQFNSIVSNISNLKTSAVPGDIWPALWKCFIYGVFQLAAVGVYISHAEAFTSKEEIKKSMIVGFLINGLMIGLASLGMFAILDKGITNVKVPTLLLVQTGVGASWMTPIISLLIILGSVSTGVNMIYGVVNRIVASLGKNENEQQRLKNEKRRSILASLAYVLLTFCIAQLGLIPLVSKGYSYLGYGTIVAIIIPIIVRIVLDITKKNETLIENHE
ncbi:MAG: YkvI family membrane protein [Fusobacteriaceae bacterium]